MKYISTRGGMKPLEFSDILLEGLAPDGGLAVPEQLPRFRPRRWNPGAACRTRTWRMKCCRASPPTFPPTICAA